jgi:hypothetical protein
MNWKYLGSNIGHGPISIKFKIFALSDCETTKNPNKKANVRMRFELEILRMQVMFFTAWGAVISQAATSCAVPSGCQ